MKRGRFRCDTPSGLIRLSEPMPFYVGCWFFISCAILDGILE